MNELRITTKNAEATIELAKHIGQRLKGGEVIELLSDLGGGKTTFVRGLADGLGSHDHVSSPTFKISNVYTAIDKELHHFDFYRLSEPGIISAELSEIIGEPDKVIVVEWGAIVEDVLPDSRLKITFTMTGEHNRQITLECSRLLAYLTEGL